MPAHNLRPDPDQAPDVDDDPPAEHYRAQIRRLDEQLHRCPPTDPDLRARLERELQQWSQLLAAETRDEHWTAGEGDRPLF